MTLEPPLIRVGLIGHGVAGAILHAPLIEAAGDFRISAIATSRADTLAQRRDAPRQAFSPREIIEADDVDLVVVVTPNETHFELAAAALKAGKHVVLDKPFVLSAAEADELIALAQTCGRMLTVFQNRRWDGDFLAVKQALASGELGEVLLAESRWDRFRPVAAPAWRNSTAPGAGVLWDLGPHLIDQALQLFGAPDEVTVDVAAQREGALADDYFELILRYGKMRCILSASCVVAATRPRFAVHGTAGGLVTYGIDPYEAALRAGRHPADVGFGASMPPIPALRFRGEAREPVNIPPGDWVVFYKRVAAAVREGAPPPVDPREARDVIALIETAFAGLRG